MNIDNLTIGELKQLQNLINPNPQQSSSLDIASDMLGKYVIIRTYSAGTWYGVLDKKHKDEIILKDARRMYYWKCLKGICLSSIALYGLDNSSKICAAVEKIWLQQIEIIPISNEGIEEQLRNFPEIQQS